MQLEILTPEKTIYKGDVDSVTLPGTAGVFTVLPRHAPLISSLRKGGVIWYAKNGRKAISLMIEGGFVEVLDNAVVVCVEGASLQPEKVTTVADL